MTRLVRNCAGAGKAGTLMVPLLTAPEAEQDMDATGIMNSGDHSFSGSREALIDVVTGWAEGCR